MAGHVEEAAGTAQLAIDTIDLVASRAPESALRRTFTEWVRVVDQRLGELWHRLLGGPASESGRLRQGDGDPSGGDRCRRRQC